MFALSALREQRVMLADHDTERLVDALGGSVVRFPVSRTGRVRFPRAQEDLHSLLAAVAAPVLRGVTDTNLAAVATAAVLAPVLKVPLVHDEVGRRFALGVAIDIAEELFGLVTVEIGETRVHGASPVTAAQAFVTAGVDVIAETLEALVMQATPEAVAAATRTARPAIWLGAPDKESGAPSWERQVCALGLIDDLAFEIIAEPGRRPRDVAQRLADTSLEVVVVWGPRARGSERAVAAFEKAAADGVVVCLDEERFEDALIEARFALQELGLVDPVAASPTKVRAVPQGGDERFYIKGKGSARGDLLIDVPSCGHGQWGSDVRRRAPRAYKGVEMLEGVRPSALFLCRRCNKNRWRARF